MLKKLLTVGVLGSLAGMIWYLLTGETKNKK